MTRRIGSISNRAMANTAAGEEILREKITSRTCAVLIIFAVMSISTFFSSRGQLTRDLFTFAVKSKVSQDVLQNERNNEIPHILWFTYEHDILESHEPKEFYENIQNTISVYKKAWGEPDAIVKFLDDEKCANLVLEAEPEFVHFFNAQPYGRFKADICRICALLLHGGYYFDVDVEVVEPLLLPPHILFSTVIRPFPKDFIQSHYVASSPRHPILRHALRDMLRAYHDPGQFTVIQAMANSHDDKPHNFRSKEFLGAEALTHAYETMTDLDRGSVKMLQEIELSESDYPDLLRQDGVGCCCNFIVVDPSISKAHFYSQFVGSSHHCSFKKIPHIMWFTYKHNILERHLPELFHDNIHHTISTYRESWGDLKAPVEFVDDKRCEEFLSRIEPALVGHFRLEPKGSTRGDICRVAALYLYGGYYFDVDLRVVEPVELSPTISFSTAVQSTHKNFFQAFIASAPKHQILKKSLDIMLDVYEGKAAIELNFGTDIMRRAYDSVNEESRGEVFLLEEINLTPNLYPELPRQKGIGCCCNFVVHDQSQVFFYSRLVGSTSRCSFDLANVGKGPPINRIPAHLTDKGHA